PEGLRALGANVEVVAAYATGPADPPHAAAVLAQLARGEIHAVTFTSPSTAQGFARLWAAHGPRPGPQGAGHGRDRSGAGNQAFVVACIGPITAEAARACGFTVDVIASVYTVPGLVQALADYRASREKGAGKDGLP
ncbi:MAG TPA: uroporphyrinogen-III synthase, partial [Limnochordales bacterium]